MTQQQKIFAHLQSQSITGLEAWKQYGVYRLSEIIRRIRKDHTVTTEMVTEGETQFAKYTLLK
jgi:hypothetical protein